jgi:hypothetical protein
MMAPSNIEADPQQPASEQGADRCGDEPTVLSRAHETVSFDYCGGDEQALTEVVAKMNSSRNDKKYSHLRFRAVVDWIEIEIETTERTNFQTVQRTLRTALGMPDDKNPRVDALNEQPGGAATIFRFRIHDPESWCDVASIIDALGKRFAFAHPSEVTAIEVAFDAYSRARNKHDLTEQAVRFYKFCTLMVSDNRRLYWKYKRSPRGIPFHVSSLARHLSDGWQIGIGNDKKDDRYQHVYVKTTDRGGIALPRAEHRARIEIKLQGEALPYEHANDWANADFATDFRMSAEFRMLRTNLDRFQKVALGNNSMQLGEKKARWRLKDGRPYKKDLLYRSSTAADSVLNEKARDAFRELTRRWRRKTCRP